MLTLEEMLGMDVRLLARFALLATREKREGLRDMALAVRAGMAQGDAFERFVRGVMDEAPPEVRSQDTWAELMFIGGR